MADHSWQPIDLTDLEPAPQRLPSTLGLSYPGARHLWSGEPETAKSWAALIACTHEIQQGRHALYLDFEADPHETAERLRALNHDDPSLSRLIYMRPTDPIGTKGVKETLTEVLDQYNPSLIVVDAYAGALDIHEMDPWKSSDIEKFHRILIEPLRINGAATIILDHVIKNKENRGKFSIGSERKTGAVDVHLSYETISPFGRGRRGLFTIKVQKDRPGWLPRPTIGTLELNSDPDTHTITWQLKPPQTTDTEHGFRPTALMEKVSRWLETRDTAASRKQTLDAITGKKEWVRHAIDELIQDGYVSEEHGPRNAHLLTSEKPYHAALDPHSPDLALPGPGPGDRTPWPSTFPPQGGGTTGPGAVGNGATTDIAPSKEPVTEEFPF